MPVTDPNHPTGIRAYIDEQVDAVLSMVASPEAVVLLTPDQTVQYSRAVMTTEEADEAEDMFGFEYDGNRTGYFNEYGEVRGRAAKDSTVAARFARRSADATANIFEVTTQGNVLLAGFAADGTIVGPSVTPSAWQNLSYASADASSGAGYATAGVRLEPLAGVVRIRGRIDISGAGFSSNATIATVPSDYRPATTFSSITRTNSAGALITINTNGTIQVASALTAGGFVQLDGITWPLA